MKAVRGFSLVELMITVVVLSILLSIAVPSFRDWIQRIETRNVAENALHALQLARSEAIKRNSLVVLTFSGGTAWTMLDSSGATIQTVQSGDGAQTSFLTLTQPGGGLPFSITFNSLGRPTGLATALILDAVGTSGASCTSAGPTGCLSIRVSLGGLIRMCDPSTAKIGTPQGCS